MSEHMNNLFREVNHLLKAYEDSVELTKDQKNSLREKISPKLDLKKVRYNDSKDILFIECRKTYLNWYENAGFESRGYKCKNIVRVSNLRLYAINNSKDNKYLLDPLH
jgi:hypothetical protein